MENENIYAKTVYQEMLGYLDEIMNAAHKLKHFTKENVKNDIMKNELIKWISAIEDDTIQYRTVYDG